MIDRFNQGLLERLRQLPSVRYAALTSDILSSVGNTTLVAEGYVDPTGPTSGFQIQLIGDYFRAIRVPLLRGRYFTDADNASSQLVVIVSHDLAEQYWPHRDPIGKRMRIGTLKMARPWMTVIGEVGDARRPNSDKNWGQFFTPVAQAEQDLGPDAASTDLNGNGGYIVVRSVLPPYQMENSIRSVVKELDPLLPLTKVRTMDEVVAQSEELPRFNTAAVTSFALVAVLLAGLGIYSIVAFSVASRAQEMAIRIALGSQSGRIVRLVLISGAKLAVAGIVIGLAGAAGAARIVRGFLFQVSPFDPAVLVLAAVAVLTLALTASIIPARRAAAVDPMQALRAE